MRPCCCCETRHIGQVGAFDDDLPDFATEPAASREELTRANRERFPEAAAFIDAVRAVYPTAPVVYLGPMREPAPPAEVDPMIDDEARALERARRAQFTTD